MKHRWKPIVAAFFATSIGFFDWVGRQTHSAYKAAFIIAGSQFLLVNVDFVLEGKRGLMTAGASTLLLILTWGCAAFGYSYLSVSKIPPNEVSRLKDALIVQVCYYI